MKKIYKAPENQVYLKKLLQNTLLRRAYILGVSNQNLTNFQRNFFEMRFNIKILASAKLVQHSEQERSSTQSEED